MKAINLPSVLKNQRVLAGIAFVILLIVGYQIKFPIYDWMENYQPRIIMLLQGQNPYTEITYVPPWFLLILSPLAMLPERLSNAILFALSFITLIVICRKLGMKPLYIIYFLISYPVFKEFEHRQLDWLIISGAFLPPTWGLFLVLSKPTVGIGIATFWAIDLFKNGGLVEVIKKFSPVIIAYLLSFLVYGPYLFHGTEQMGMSYDVSLWPFGIPVGIFLLYQAIKKKKIQYSIASSPFFAPYLAIYSWMVALIGVSNNKFWFAILCLLTWMIPVFQSYNFSF